MPAITIGLFDKDTMIYYIDSNMVVCEDPYTLGMIIVLTKPNPVDTDWLEANKVLNRLKYNLKGTPTRRPDGLWVCDVEEI